MPVNNIIHQLALVEKNVMPGATIYENLPESVGQLPAVLHFLPSGSLPFLNRSVTYDFTHTIESRILFSRADLPTSDATVKKWIDPMRVAIDKDSKLGGAAHNSGMTGYQYGRMEYGGDTFLTLTLNIQAIEKVVAGEVAGS